MKELHRLHEAFEILSATEMMTMSVVHLTGVTAGSQLLELKATWSTAACQPSFTEQIFLPVMIDNQFAIRTNSVWLEIRRIGCGEAVL